MIIATTFSSIIFLFSVLQVVQTERAVFYRERAANMYNTIPYALSFTLAEIPYLIVSTLLFAVVFYFTVGLYDSGTKFFYFWLFYCLMLSVATFTGQLIACVTPNTESANVVSSLVFNLWNTFSGFMISPASIPAYWSFMHWISPFHYIVEGMALSQFHGIKDLVNVSTSSGTETMTMEEYVKDYFGGKFSYSNRGRDIIALLAIMVIFNVLRTLALQYVQMIKR